MLIYNHKKEFIGIDETDLTSLGFSSLSDFQDETDDFADLFVKEPGHIHNFKHIHWIDFAECSDSEQSSKVIIKTSSKSFKCNIEVRSAYLVDSASEKAFLIYLQNLREISVTSDGEVIETLISTSLPKIQEDTPKPVVVDEATFEQDSIQNEQIEPDVEEETVIQTESIKSEEQESKEVQTPQLSEDTDDESGLELNLEEPLNIEFDEEENQLEEDEDEETQSGYVYDPHVASEELGLPVDLIEEFIQDFIDQSREFKNKLYSSFESGDTSTVKSLSHKLKGVAANLRVEDALEVLTVINTSDNLTEVKSNLDNFYIIISKLAGEKVKPTKKIKKSVTSATSKKEPIQDIESQNSNEDDDLKIDFKDDIKIEDEKIEPEMQLEQKSESENEDDLLLSFKDDEQSYIKVDIPKELESKNDQEDDLVIDFKNENDYEQESLKELEVEPEDKDDDDFTIDFKYDDAVETESTKNDKTQNPANEAAVKYNKESAAKEIGLDTESFNELFDDYISEAKTISSKINDAVQDQNNAIWISNAIQLKSMSDNMRVEDLTSELETLMNTKDVKVAKKASEKINILISKISNTES